MLTPTERAILKELQKAGRLSNVELAQRAGLSESPCLRRVKHLEATGIIKGYTAIIDQRKVGFDVTAFIQVNLDQRSETETKKFLKAVRQEDRIIDCTAMSGGYDYLLKVIAQNIDDFADLTMRRLLRFPGVKDVSSAFVLEELKTRGPIPV